MDHFYDNRRSREENPALAPQQMLTLYRPEHAVVNVPSSVGTDSESDLLVYWNSIRRHKAVIALFALCFAVLGFLIGLPQKPVYRARTALEVLNLNDDFMNMRQTSPTASNDLSNDTSELQTEATLLQSTTLLEAVVAKLDDRVRPRTNAWVKAETSSSFNWKRFLHLEPDSRTPREILLDKATDSLRVRALPRTRVLDVTVDSTDPQLAADYASTLADLFIQRSVETRWSATEKTDDILKREINDARAKLERSEEALQAYAGSSGLIFSDQEDDSTLSTEKLQQLQYQLDQATADRILKQSRYNRAQSSTPDSLPDVLLDSALRDEAAKVSLKRSEVARLSTMFTPEYSKLKQAKAELAELESAFARDRNSVVQKVTNDYREAVVRENLLRAECTRQEKEVTQQGEKAVKYNVLKREVESNRDLYDSMLRQLKQSSVASAVGASKIHVVDQAETYEKPVRPNFKINTAVGACAGLFFGVVFVLTRDQTDRTLRKPGDAKLWTNLPELGTIPNAISVAKQRIAQGLPVSPDLLGANGLSDKAGNFAALTQSKSQHPYLADSVRNVVTSILFRNDDGQVRPRVLAITSPDAGDGKTTVVSHLGIALSEIEGNVLIIDADLRRPRLAEIFKLSNERGLSDFLGDVQFRSAALDGLIQQTKIPGLHLLTSGPAVPSAATLFYTPVFAELLRSVRSEYSMVIIDTPPMLDMTDARVIGRLTDGVVLVTRAGQTTRDALMAANQRLTEDNIKILGTIFNDWTPKDSSSWFYSRKRSYRTSREDDAAGNGPRRTNFTNAG